MGRKHCTSPPRMHPNENLLATQTPIHANMSHAVGPDSGSRARPRARSARTHQTTGCRAPRATCARRRRATPQGRSSRPRGTAAPTCRAAQASVGLHATRAPPPTPDRGARTCRISPVHVRRQTLHGSSASPIFVTVYEASQTGIARRSVRASSTSAAHTRMQACDRSGCASSQSKGGTSSADARVGEWTGRHVPCPCRRRVAARDARYAGADARSPTVALVHAEDVGGRATRFATLAAPGSSLMIVVALAVRPAHRRGRTAAGSALGEVERLGRSLLSSGRAVDLRPSEQVVGMLEWVVPVRSRPAAAPGVLSAARGKSSPAEDSCQIRRLR